MCQQWSYISLEWSHQYDLSNVCITINHIWMLYQNFLLGLSCRIFVISIYYIFFISWNSHGIIHLVHSYKYFDFWINNLWNWISGSMKKEWYISQVNGSSDVVSGIQFPLLVMPLKESFHESFVHSSTLKVFYWSISDGPKDIQYASISGNLQHILLSNHWGRVTHLCVGNLAIIGSHNGLSPRRRQVIVPSNAGLLSIGSSGTNFDELSIKILTFSFKKMHLKVSSAKWRPYCPGLNVLKQGKYGAAHHWNNCVTLVI